MKTREYGCSIQKAAGIPWEDVGEKKRLPRDFFTRDGITLARELLGKVLVHETAFGTVRGVILETESYMGETDQASHAYGGRRTKRTEPMYHTGGTSYVYLIYGMYRCMNIAALTEGTPQAVLLRSVEPADEASWERMLRLRLMQLNRRQENRGAPGYTPEHCPPGFRAHLADGPGKLCTAMSITERDNDVDLVTSGNFYVTEGMWVPREKILTGKRIGIDYAGEAAEYPWRFFLGKR